MTGKTSRVSDITTNYDSVVKGSVSVYSDKAVSFFGLPGYAVIVEPLRTEKQEITVSIEYSDLTFRMSDGRGLHIEVEAHVSKDDVLRFCGYHVDLARKYKREFVTVVFARKSIKKPFIAQGMLRFEPQIVYHSDYDADELLGKIVNQIKLGIPINELELIHLPLFKSEKYKPEELLKEAVAIVRDLPADEDTKMKLAAMLIVVSNKIVSKDILDEIWE